MPAGVLLAPFRTGTTHVMELRLIGPRLFDQQRSADIRHNCPCLQSACRQARRRIREHLIHPHSPIDGDLMIDGQDVLREICPSRHMFSRGKPRRRYRNLIEGRMADRLPRQGLRPPELTRRIRVGIAGWRARGESADAYRSNISRYGRDDADRGSSRRPCRGFWAGGGGRAIGSAEAARANAGAIAAGDGAT